MYDNKQVHLGATTATPTTDGNVDIEDDKEGNQNTQEGHCGDIVRFDANVLSHMEQNLETLYEIEINDGDFRTDEWGE